MIEYHMLDVGDPSFDELVTNLLDATWKTQPSSGYKGAFSARSIGRFGSAHDAGRRQRRSAEVRGVASLKLDELKKWIATQARR